MHMQLWRINENTFNLRVFNKQFVGLDNQGQGKNINAISTTPGNAETFQIVRKQDDPSRIRLRASNGLFVQVYFALYSETVLLAFFSVRSNISFADCS